MYLPPITALRYPETPVLCIYLLKQNRVIVPDEIHANYPAKNIYRKDPKFSYRSYAKTVQTEIRLLLGNRSDKSLHGCYFVCTLL